MENYPLNNIITVAPSMGDSMSPLIKDACKLEVRLGNMQKFRIGDIALFLENNRVVAHRIIRMKKEGEAIEFLLKGDNNKDVDRFFKKEELVGKLEKIIYPDYVINLHNKRNKVMSFLLTAYSLLNLKWNCLLKLRGLYKIRVFKALYRNLVKSQDRP